MRFSAIVNLNLADLGLAIRHGARDGDDERTLLVASCEPVVESEIRRSHALVAKALHHASGRKTAKPALRGEQRLLDIGPLELALTRKGAASTWNLQSELRCLDFLDFWKNDALDRLLLPLPQDNGVDGRLVLDFANHANQTA